MEQQTLDERGRVVEIVGAVPWATTTGTIDVLVTGEAEPSDMDTSGHAFDRATFISVKIAGVDDQDTEGHTLGLRFPNAEDAAAFRRRLAAGAITASIVVGVGLAATAGAGQVATLHHAGSGTGGAAAVAVEPNMRPLVEPHTSITGVEPNMRPLVEPHTSITGVEPNLRPLVEPHTSITGVEPNLRPLVEPHTSITGVEPNTRPLVEPHT